MVMKIIKRRMASFRKAPAAARDFAEAVDASNYRTSLTPGRSAQGHESGIPPGVIVIQTHPTQ